MSNQEELFKGAQERVLWTGYGVTGMGSPSKRKQLYWRIIIIKHANYV